jgi:hypothetical protein
MGVPLSVPFLHPQHNKIDDLEHHLHGDLGGDLVRAVLRGASGDRVAANDVANRRAFQDPGLLADRHAAQAGLEVGDAGTSDGSRQSRSKVT